jgi:hypothetical protein
VTAQTPADSTTSVGPHDASGTPFMIRPRVTELGAAGLIERTGAKRQNPNSTLNAAVWRASSLLLGSAAQ